LGALREYLIAANILFFVPTGKVSLQAPPFGPQKGESSLLYLPKLEHPSNFFSFTTFFSFLAEPCDNLLKEGIDLDRFDLLGATIFCFNVDNLFFSINLLYVGPLINIFFPVRGFIVVADIL
jgi:hypothetical protein